MNDRARILWLTLGLILGGCGTWAMIGQNKPVKAANDRYEDFILCTGPVTIMPGTPTDGVWLLDYRAGKLLGGLIERSSGKLGPWAEVDLVTEFAIAPKQDVHFMMTTGSVAHGQAALYVAETTTGRFAVYTMGPRPDGRPGIAIRRHDQTLFRAARKD